MRRSFWLLPLAAGLVFGSAVVPKAHAGNLGDAVEPSNAEQLNLARQLKQAGVIFYGAWWCGACFHQKNLFGTEAGRELPYVECDKDDAGREQCRQAQIKAFPTWVLGDQRAEGVMTLPQLRNWAGL